MIVIEGKANSIAIDGCKKTGVVFDECIATCEVMNSSAIQLQIKEKVPAIAVDKTAGKRRERIDCCFSQKEKKKVFKSICPRRASTRRLLPPRPRK